MSNCVQQNPVEGLNAERQDKCNRMTRGLVLELQRIVQVPCDAPQGSVARVLLRRLSLAEQRSAGPIGG
jgi:hypothetical protein